MLSLEKNEMDGERATNNPAVNNPIAPNLLRKGYNRATVIMPNKTGNNLKEKSVKPKMYVGIKPM